MEIALVLGGATAADVLINGNQLGAGEVLSLAGPLGVTVGALIGAQVGGMIVAKLGNGKENSGTLVLLLSTMLGAGAVAVYLGGNTWQAASPMAIAGVGMWWYSNAT